MITTDSRIIRNAQQIVDIEAIYHPIFANRIVSSVDMDDSLCVTLIFLDGATCKMTGSFAYDIKYGTAE